MSARVGHATSEGTQAHADRHTELYRSAAFRDLGSLRLSTVGLGTYLGEADADTDAGYTASVRAALDGGINVVDTAINYRNQRSERVVGQALAALMDEGKLRREEVFVSTKGGFVPFDADEKDPQAAAHKAYVDTGLVTPDNLAQGIHCMAPKYLEDQVTRSRRNLGLETIDLYYVQNPETQMQEVDQHVFYYRLKAAFVALERAVDAGHIVRYGIATWPGLREQPDSRGHIDLARAVGCAEQAAKEVGTERHHFGAVQAPLNVGMPEAAVVPTQVVDGETVTLTEACQRLGLGLFTSGSILQGRLAKGMPPQVRDRIGFAGTDAQNALQATRSAPGVTTALVGMSQVQHVQEALGLLEAAPPDATGIWESLASSAYAGRP